MSQSTFLLGNCLETLSTLPEKSIQCVITSPPYFGLRDYGTAEWQGGDPNCDHKVGNQVSDNKANGAITSGVRPGVDASTCKLCGASRLDLQIGLEPTPEAYIQKLVEVFAQVWRVLRDDGTLFINIGDSYNGSGGPGSQRDNKVSKGKGEFKKYNNPNRDVFGLKPKDLIGIPWMLAFALRAAGWYLRSEIIWHKPNPMPESVKDRPTKSHEQIFLFSKSPDYFYDYVAILEPAAYDGRKDTHFKGSTKNYDLAMPGGKPQTFAQRGHDRGQRSWPKNLQADGQKLQTMHVKREEAKDQYGLAGTGFKGHSGNNGSDGESLLYEKDGIAARNKRDVWTVTTKPYKEAHFATFPPDLIEPCILAGTSAKGQCPHCGSPWVRITEVTIGEAKETPKTESAHRARGGKGKPVGTVGKSGGSRVDGQVSTLGWQPSCNCPPHDPIPQTVLDPFSGSGTTIQVALKHHRNGIGCELNPEYIALAERRLAKTQIAFPGDAFHVP